MAVMPCPHCHETNAQVGSFCEYCGKAMPSVEPTTPRIIEGDDLAQTSAGRELQSEELHKQTKKAAGALLAAAIFQTFSTFFVFMLMLRIERNVELAESMALAGLDANIVRLIFAVSLAVAGIFYSLWWWSRTNPLPAAIVGLVVYGSLVFLSGLADPQGIAGRLIINIIIIAMLIRAIQAGVKHRQLLREGAAAV